MTLYQIQSHNLEFENEFFSNIKKCVRVKSDTLNFLEWEKKYGNLELSASDFNRTHLKLPNVHIVQCWCTTSVLKLHRKYSDAPDYDQIAQIYPAATRLQKCIHQRRQDCKFSSGFVGSFRSSIQFETLTLCNPVFCNWEFPIKRDGKIEYNMLEIVFLVR